MQIKLLFLDAANEKCNTVNGRWRRRERWVKTLYVCLFVYYCNGFCGPPLEVVFYYKEERRLPAVHILHDVCGGSETRISKQFHFAIHFLKRGGALTCWLLRPTLAQKKAFKNSWINFVSLCCREAITNTVVLLSPKAFIVLYKKKVLSRFVSPNYQIYA